MPHKLGMGVGAALAVVILGQSAGYAATAATATMSSQQIGVNSYEYSFSLTNTGTAQINTFWTAWIVYGGSFIYDLLPTKPTSVLSPSGWVGQALNDSPSLSPGYYGVEWYSPTGLAPGQTLSGFKFDSPDAPAVVEGTSFFSGYPVRESWVYNGLSQSEAGFELTPTIVPEPAAVGLLALLAGGILLRQRRATI